MRAALTAVSIISDVSGDQMRPTFTRCPRYLETRVLGAVVFETRHVLQPGLTTFDHALTQQCDLHAGAVSRRSSDRSWRRHDTYKNALIIFVRSKRRA